MASLDVLDLNSRVGLLRHLSLEARLMTGRYLDAVAEFSRTFTA
jgi:hypothetical protein